MTAYVQTLLAEIAATPRQNHVPLETVYVGGGTPSLTPPALVESLLLAIEDRYGIAPGAEISFEADPGTFDASRLRQYRALGVNRLSVGVQAFQDSALRRCGRSHTLADVHAALRAVRESGMPSWSLDLMSGLPGLTLEEWGASLAAAAAAQPTHISVYDLQLEPGTPFAALYRPGERPLPSDDVAADMFGLASATLQTAGKGRELEGGAGGYEHYEISNYGRSGHRSRHNSMYWAGGPFYGFGMGAASYLQGRRFSRPKTLAAYQRWVAEFQASSGVPGEAQEQESRADHLLDAVMLRCRLKDGVALGVLRSIAGDAEHEGALLAALQPHSAAGRVWVEVDVAGLPVRFGLTDPAGFLLSNDVISDIFAALDGS